jgi:5-dehydro-4-deoxyglucarate dehydratase
MITPQDLKQTLSSGLLSFPITDFDANGDFKPGTYIERLEWLAPYGATALFVAGGTGEFFSMTPEDYSQVVRTAVETCRGKVPILAGAGGPTRTAIAYAQEAERLGAHGILLMPHYLTEASQDGLVDHVEAVCKSVKFGVVVYNRNVCRLNADSLLKLADRCPNLIGFKDGVGEIESMVTIAAASATASVTSAACPPPKSMPPPTRRSACRYIPRPCSTSFRRPRWNFMKRSAPTTTPPPSA